MRNEKSVGYANTLCTALYQFSACRHNGLVTDIVRQKCAENLNTVCRNAEEFISSAARFGYALADNAIVRASEKVRRVAEVVAGVLKDAIECRHSYFKNYSEFQSDEVEEYKNHHAMGNYYEENHSADWLTEEARTGEFFPGRARVRPGLDFGTNSRKQNVRECRKSYLKSDSHSPGIFTVQCVCKRPKLIGISVMVETEGVSTALSVLLSHFRNLPRVCYYDNGCNIDSSIVLRIPLVNDEFIVACDRFHYKAHKCYSIYDPDSYVSCKGHVTSGAESVNQLWTFSKSRMRFLRPENFMPFLAARAIFLNVRACIRDSTGKSDITTKQFKDFLGNKWSCTCGRCSKRKDGIF